MKKSVPRTKRNYGWLVLMMFVVFAFFLVLALEYVDYRNGKPSIFFKPVKTVRPNIDKKPVHELNWDSIFSSDAELTDRFFDETELEHINVKVVDSEFRSFRNRLNHHISAWGGSLKLIEFNKKDSYNIYLFHVFKNSLKTHVLLVYSVLETKETPRQPVEPVRTAIGQKKVAFIIDDIGSKPKIVDQLADLGIPITVSVLVDEPYAAQEVEAAKARKMEMMIHLPMEPLNGNMNDLHGVVMPDSSQEQIEAILTQSQQVVPLAQGINNHQGSLVTADPRAMRLVLGILKAKKLYFVDSRTNIDSVAYKIAQDMGVPSTAKDFFIDHIPTIQHSREQFEKLFRILKTKESAVMIGHPHASTFLAIKEAIPKLNSFKISIVYVSELVH